MLLTEVIFPQGCQKLGVRCAGVRNNDRSEWPFGPSKGVAAAFVRKDFLVALMDIVEWVVRAGNGCSYLSGWSMWEPSMRRGGAWSCSTSRRSYRHQPTRWARDRRGNR
jgi:hypothetical protein